MLAHVCICMYYAMMIRASAPSPEWVSALDHLVTLGTADSNVAHFSDGPPELVRGLSVFQHRPAVTRPGRADFAARLESPTKDLANPGAKRAQSDQWLLFLCQLHFHCELFSGRHDVTLTSDTAARAAHTAYRPPAPVISRLSVSANLAPPKPFFLVLFFPFFFFPLLHP